MTPGEIIDKFAAVWRAIGQPPTDGLIVLVMDETDECHAVGSEILGMPVYVVESLIGTCPIAIAELLDMNSGVLSKFRQAWEEM